MPGRWRPRATVRQIPCRRVAFQRPLNAIPKADLVLESQLFLFRRVAAARMHPGWLVGQALHLRVVAHRPGSQFRKLDKTGEDTGREVHRAAIVNLVDGRHDAIHAILDVNEVAHLGAGSPHIEDFRSTIRQHPLADASSWSSP